ncbi:MAG: hypothetical protein OEM60_12075 [Gammaproteobacteria bacterium]|nr:hypothetical protein [Gammaproteobacteria bacterium]MDH3430440.1 hypothetical protein [Gammaproteobacteria bacterium]MDH3434592.1 hypothetical protein [Gammaproteobacteria bacterium]
MLVIAVILAMSLLMLADANAVDGNYVSPYGSQWDTRSKGASVPDETLLGMLLLTLNLIAATIFYVKDRLRRSRRPT